MEHIRTGFGVSAHAGEGVEIASPDAFVGVGIRPKVDVPDQVIVGGNTVNASQSVVLEEETRRR